MTPSVSGRGSVGPHGWLTRSTSIVACVTTTQAPSHAGRGAGGGGAGGGGGSGVCQTQELPPP